VAMKSKMLGRTISVFVGFLLLIPPLSAQPCQRVDLSQNSCCCCCPCCQNSVPSLSDSDVERAECACQIREKQQEESSPAVIFSQHDGRPEISFSSSQVEGFTEDCPSQLTGLPPHSYLLPTRDQPLYILHSSLLI